ncbi:cell wall hydrolase [Phenylobacterium sp.]|uniref:cell wall hydrolase n=1 Tax=Phenylobacterium sp. TaxID=1871053 RepID=UPI003983C8E9
MKSGTQASAEWRVLVSAALIGSGVGLGLGWAYMAGGMAQAATDHNRAVRIAQAAEGGFSESVLQRNTTGIDAGVLRVARTHAPLTTTDAAERERQAAMLADRLDRQQAAKAAPPMRDSLDKPFRSAAAPSSDLECLTQAVYFEARGETPRGQQAVAQVVLNRVRHPAFPKTVCGVVFQGAAKHRGCQFSFACDGSMRRGREASAWTRARQVAARTLSGAVLGDVGSATHFHTTNVAPQWGPRMRRMAQVGVHVFYGFNGRGPAAQAYRPAAPSVEQAVLTSAPHAVELMIAAAVVEKAADAAVGAITPALATTAQPAPPPAAEKAAPATVQAPEPAEAAALKPATPADAAAS